MGIDKAEHVGIRHRSVLFDIIRVLLSAPFSAAVYAEYDRQASTPVFLPGSAATM
jgi:hypothetical protein